MDKSNQISRHITDIYIYIMLLIYPLFLGFHGYTRLTDSKFAFFVISTLLWLFSIVIIHLVLRTAPKLRLKNPVMLCVLMFLVFNIISASFSKYGTVTFIGLGRYDGLLSTMLCIGIFLGVSQFARPKRTYIYALALSVSICCIISIIQLFGINPLKLFPSNYNYYDKGLKFSGEFMGTIGNADLTSAFLCIAVPMFSVFYITDYKASKANLALLTTIFISAFCLLHCTVSAGKLALLTTIILATPFLITDTRRLRKALELLAIFLVALSISNAFSGEKIDNEVFLHFIFTAKHAILISTAAIVFIASLFVEKISASNKLLRTVFSIISVLTVMCGLVFAYNYSGTSGSFYEVSQILHGNFDDSFGSSRIRIWRESLAVFTQNPLLGGGPGTLAERINIHFSRYVTETDRTLACTVDNAHNFYISTLINTGIFSLLFFVVAQVITIIKATNSKSSMKFVACIAVALLCYWIQAFFSLELFITTPFMWLLWGLLVEVLYNNKSSMPQATEAIHL